MVLSLPWILPTKLGREFGSEPKGLPRSLQGSWPEVSAVGTANSDIRRSEIPKSYYVFVTALLDFGGAPCGIRAYLEHFQNYCDPEPHG